MSGAHRDPTRLSAPLPGRNAEPAATLDGLLALGGLLARFPCPWWVAGGWAIDAWAGGASREHEDLEISVLRQDLAALRTCLHPLGWRLARFSPASHGGSWLPLADGETVHPPEFQLRARRMAEDSAGTSRSDGTLEPATLNRFEIFLNDLTDEGEGAHRRWVSRRHPTVVLPLTALVVASPLGLPVLAPEVQLLYKAKYHRPKDEHDFGRALPRLSAAQRDWLAQTLREYHPTDPWLTALGQGNRGSDAGIDASRRACVPPPGGVAGTRM